MAPLIEIDEILAFLQSDFAKQIIAHQKTLHREATFAMIMPANDIYDTLEDSAPVLIHGIIDGYFVDEASQQSRCLIIKPTLFGNAQIDEDLTKLQARYKGQLHLYQQALQRNMLVIRLVIHN